MSTSRPSLRRTAAMTDSAGGLCNGASGLNPISVFRLVSFKAVVARNWSPPVHDAVHGAAQAVEQIMPVHLGIGEPVEHEGRRFGERPDRSGRGRRRRSGLQHEGAGAVGGIDEGSGDQAALVAGHGRRAGTGQRAGTGRHFDELEFQRRAAGVEHQQLHGGAHAVRARRRKATLRRA